MKRKNRREKFWEKFKIEELVQKDTEHADSSLGFGDKIERLERLINKDGSFNVKKKGESTMSLYHWLVERPWWQFWCIVVIAYLIANTAFALGFMVIGIEQLVTVSKGSLAEDFINAFFFSTQTFTTVGYGAVHPQGVASNLLASINALMGLIFAALATGLLFVRFSRVQSQIRFSENALITPYRDTKNNCFQFRIANQRDHKVVKLSATVVLTWVDETRNGLKRRFERLDLEWNKVALLPLNWTIVHVIDKDSPIRNWSRSDFARKSAEFVVFIEGYDEIYAQTVHIESSYTCEEIRWGAVFEIMYHAEDSKVVLDLDKINNYTLLDNNDD